MKARSVRLFAAATFALALGAGVAAPLLQRQLRASNGQARQALERLRRARIDLGEGLLHLTLAGEPGVPWDRGTGLALIDQALEDLGTPVLPGAPPDPALTAAIASFRAALDTVRSAPSPSPEAQTRLRLAATPLLVEARRQDAAQRAAWRAYREHQLTVLDAVLWFVAGCFLLAGLGFWFAASVQAKTSAAVAASELRLRQLALAFPGVFWLAERGGRVLFMTGAQARLWGYAAGALPKDGPLSWTEYVHPDDVERVRAAAAGEISSLVYRVAPPGETVRWVRVVTASVDGAPDLQAGFALDITHERALEARLRESEKLELMGQLARGVVHDLNNLLSVVQVAAESLRQPLPDAERTEVLDDLADVAERSTRLTRQLLAFNRRREVHLARVDVNQLARDTGGLFQRLLRPGVTLALELCDGPLPVTGEQALLEQALLNLLLNARDAMPNGGALTLRTRRDGGRARVSVTDTGTGIPPDVRERIFEPLFTTKHDGHGTGIGLATVKSVVEQHAGEVLVDTELGKGTTFALVFPVARERAAAPAESTGPSCARGG